VQYHIAYRMETLLSEVETAVLNAEAYILITSVLIRYSASFASITR